MRTLLKGGLAVIAAGVAMASSACVTAPASKSYAALRAEAPRSVLVVPALNSTVNVDAACARGSA